MKYEIDYRVMNYGVWQTLRHKEKEVTEDEAEQIASTLREMGAKECRSEFYKCTYFKQVTDCSHHTLYTISD